MRLRPGSEEALVLFCLGGSRRSGVEWNDAAGAPPAEYPGRTRSFTWRRWTWADSIRAGSPRGRLRWVHRLINGGLDGNNACWLGYTADGAVVLGTDRIDDWLMLGPNPSDSVSNSQCTVWRGTPGDGTRATMAGRTVYLSLKVQFNANWRGGKTIYGALRAPARQLCLDSCLPAGDNPHLSFPR
jgi:hypothetical protein